MNGGIQGTRWRGRPRRTWTDDIKSWTGRNHRLPAFGAQQRGLEIRGTPTQDGWHLGTARQSKTKDFRYVCFSNNPIHTITETKSNPKKI